MSTTHCVMNATLPCIPSCLIDYYQEAIAKGEVVLINTIEANLFSLLI